MKWKNLIIGIIIISIIISCTRVKKVSKKPIFDSHGKIIGDSIFNGFNLIKVKFYDRSYIVDSIVLERYENSSVVKSIQSFKQGKKIFENIYYNQNGTISEYLFVDEDNSNFYYQRIYDKNGNLLKVNGNLFFQGFITTVDANNYMVKLGTPVLYKIFYPNPPDCNVDLYIRNRDTLLKVFHKSNFIPYLSYAENDNNQIGTFQVEIVLKLKETAIDTSIYFHRDFIYKVSQ